MSVSNYPNRNESRGLPLNPGGAPSRSLAAQRPRQQSACRLPIELVARLSESLDVKTIRAVEEGLYGGRPVPILWLHLAKPVMAAIGSALPRPYPSFSQLCQRGIPPQSRENLSPLARFEATRALLPGAKDTRLYEQLEYTWETVRDEAYRLVGSAPLLVTDLLEHPLQTRPQDRLRVARSQLVALRPMALIRDFEQRSSCVVMLDSFVNYLDSVLRQEFQGNVLGALVGMTTTFGNYFR